MSILVQDHVLSGKLTWQWKMNLLKMYSLLKMGILHCYVGLPGLVFLLNKHILPTRIKVTTEGCQMPKKEFA